MKNLLLTLCLLLSFSYLLSAQEQETEEPQKTEATKQKARKSTNASNFLIQPKLSIGAAYLENESNIYVMPKWNAEMHFRIFHDFFLGIGSESFVAILQNAESSDRNFNFNHFATFTQSYMSARQTLGFLSFGYLYAAGGDVFEEGSYKVAGGSQFGKFTSSYGFIFERGNMANGFHTIGLSYTF